MITGVEKVHMIVASIFALGMNVWYYNDPSLSLKIFTAATNFAAATIFACAAWDAYWKDTFNK
jgi:hypothetical protein